MVTCCDHGCCADGAAIWKGGDYLLDISCGTALQNLCQGDASWQQGAALNDAVIHSPADRMPSAAEPATHPLCQHHAHTMQSCSKGLHWMMQSYICLQTGCPQLLSPQHNQMCQHHAFTMQNCNLHAASEHETVMQPRCSLHTTTARVVSSPGPQLDNQSPNEHARHCIGSAANTQWHDGLS